MKQPASQAKGYTFTIIAGMSFGFQPLLASLMRGVGVQSLMIPLLNSIWILPVFAVLILRDPNSHFRLTRRQFIQLFLLAWFGGGMTSVLLISSYVYIDTGIGTTLSFSYPVFVLIFGAVIYHEKIIRRDWMCILLCMAGILLFCNPTSVFSWKGFFMALGSGLTYAFYILYMDKSGLQQQIGTKAFTFWLFLLMSTFYLPVAIAFGQFYFPITPRCILIQILYTVVCCIGGNVFLQIGIKTIGSRKSSILNSLEPVTSVIVGILFLGEPLTWVKILGVACVISSIMILVLSESKEISAAAEAQKIN